MAVVTFAVRAAVPAHWPNTTTVNVEMLWRWLHIVSAILWIGFLYFFNLVSTPFAGQLDASTRMRIMPGLMWRALNWFRWASLVTVLSGLAYLGDIVTADAHNGSAHQGAYWGSFFGIWILAWVIFYGLLRTGRAPLVYIGTAVVIAAASWLFLNWNTHGWESNRALCIGIGGGMGFFLLLNVWGIVWRANKKILRAMEAAGAGGAAMPAETPVLARQSTLTARFSFWLTFVIIFFMAAASHFPLFGT
jgi:uncharacterized membrane protein